MSTDGRNIVVCCDGTGNEPKATGATNVFELVGMLRGHANQLVYYDPGLGTESAPGAQTWIAKSTTKLLGLAFGYGLNKNIVDAYTYLMNHYEPEDRIFLFGFSRGAYTARAIAGMLHTIGLLERGSDHLLPYAIKKYTQQGDREWEDIGAFKGTLCRQMRATSPRYAVPVHFLGVWDTVKSVGLFRGSVQLPYTRAIPNVASARHAVALKEKRSKFRPDLWAATGSADGDVKTVWFDGVHADVGGGYPATERGLADIALDWMLEGAEKHGLLADRSKFAKSRSERFDQTRKMLHADADDVSGAVEKHYAQEHNSLMPIWWIALWWKRDLPDRAWIHSSAVDRLLAQSSGSLDHPLDLLPKLGASSVCIEGDHILVRQEDGVLLQRLQPGELEHLRGQNLPADSDAAISALRNAGISEWRRELARCVESNALDLSEASRSRATELLETAAAKIAQGEIKGEDGALAVLEKFLRMQSLKRPAANAQARQAIIDTAPHLLESLAESG